MGEILDLINLDQRLIANFHEHEVLIIRKALDAKVPVEIYHNDEAGILQWSVAIEGTEFWLNSFPTCREAVEYCKHHGLTFTRVYGLR